MLISDSLQPSSDQTRHISSRECHHRSLPLTLQLPGCRKTGVGMGGGVLPLLFSCLQTPTPLQMLITATALEDPKLTHPRAL